MNIVVHNLIESEKQRTRKEETMKKIIALLLFFATVSFLAPYSWMLLFDAYSGDGTTTPVTSSQSTSIAPNPEDASTDESEPPAQATVIRHDEFTIYLTDQNNVMTIPVKDYLIGAVAVEMSLSYPVEAIKAQIVAAYSYAVARSENKDSSDTPMNADFSATPSSYQGFATKDELVHLWGDSYDSNYSYIGGIVDVVLGETILYEGNPALSCYFPLSNGKTLPSKSVFDVPLPYLVSVESPYDMHSPEYEQKITFTAQQIYDVLVVAYPEIKLTGEPIDWFSGASYDDYGYLIDISAGGVKITSEELRSSLGLRSTSMQIEYTDEVFIFTTQGIGHGVGMSQYGAKMLAENGYNYKEILGFYYPNTTVGQF